MEPRPDDLSSYVCGLAYVNRLHARLHASCLHIQPTAFICPVRSILCCRWKCSATRPSHAAYNGERAPNFVHGACVTCARCELQGSGHSWLLYVCTWIHSQHLACFSIVMDTLMCAIVWWYVVYTLSPYALHACTPVKPCMLFPMGACAFGFQKCCGCDPMSLLCYLGACLVVLSWCSSF